VWEVGNLVALLWVGLQRKNLAVDAEATDSVICTKPQSGEQGVSIFQAQVGQLRQGISPLHPGKCCRRRGAELDRLVSKYAAEAKAGHGLPQFIAVIDNWITVAIDTQTRYGTWATATHL
jgi:hypothetical protein